MQALAANLSRLIRANPGLVVLSLGGTGPTMRLAGYALLDDSTRDVVLVVGRITAIIADRRIQ